MLFDFVINHLRHVFMVFRFELIDQIGFELGSSDTFCVNQSQLTVTAGDR